MLKDDDAWLKFTFPFPFITSVGAGNCDDRLHTCFMNARMLYIIEGSLTEMTFARMRGSSLILKCVAYHTNFEKFKKAFEIDNDNVGKIMLILASNSSLNEFHDNGDNSSKFCRKFSQDGNIKCLKNTSSSFKTQERETSKNTEPHTLKSCIGV